MNVHQAGLEDHVRVLLQQRHRVGEMLRAAFDLHPPPVGEDVGRFGAGEREIAAFVVADRAAHLLGLVDLRLAARQRVTDDREP